MIRIIVCLVLLFYSFEIISSKILIDCHYDTDETDIKSNDTIYCSSKVINEIVRDKNSTGKTAPKPQWVKVDWYLYKNKIGLKFSWKQNALKVKKFVAGYIIEIKSLTSLHYIYQFNITINKWKDVKENEDILFHFATLPSKLENFLLLAGTQYTVLITSLPNYSTRNFPENTRLTIPGCCFEDDLLQHAEVCSESKCFLPTEDPEYPVYPDYPIEETSSEDTKDFGIMIFIAVVLIIFCAVSVVNLYLMKKRKTHKRRQFEDAETLVITSTSNTTGRPPHWDFTSEIAYQIQEAKCLKKNMTSDNKVKCNLWEMNESISDPNTWFCEKVVNKSCKQIVIIEANCKSTNDVLTAAIKWLTHGKLNSVLLRVFVLYFGDCCPDYVKDIKSNVPVTCYQIPKDLKTALNKISVIKGSRNVVLDQLKCVAEKVELSLPVV